MKLKKRSGVLDEGDQTDDDDGAVDEEFPPNQEQQASSAGAAASSGQSGGMDDQEKSSAIAGAAARASSWQTPDNSSDKKKAARAFSRDSFFGDAANAEPIMIDDSVSKYSHDSSGRKLKPGPGQDKVRYWVDQMPLQEVLIGNRKYGVEIHQADLALAKLEPAQVLQLKGHIQCARWASMLSQERKSKTQDELMQAIDGLTPKGLKFPSDLQVFMWRREMAERTDGILAEGFVMKRF